MNCEQKGKCRYSRYDRTAFTNMDRSILIAMFYIIGNFIEMCKSIRFSIFLDLRNSSTFCKFIPCIDPRLKRESLHFELRLLLEFHRVC